MGMGMRGQTDRKMMFLLGTFSFMAYTLLRCHNENTV